MNLDIAPSDNVPTETKHQLETKAMEKILEDVTTGLTKEENLDNNDNLIEKRYVKRMKEIILNLFLDYEARKVNILSFPFFLLHFIIYFLFFPFFHSPKTPEAEICKGIDLLDMEITGLFYKRSQKMSLKSGFFQDADEIQANQKLLGTMRELGGIVVEKRTVEYK